MSEQNRCKVRTGLSVLLAAGLVYMVGLGWERQDAASHGAHPYQPEATARKPVGPFVAKQIGSGRPWSLAEHRGRVVLINVFATWCPPCRAETPDLVWAAQEYGKQGLDVVGVSMDDTSKGTAPVEAFGRNYHVTYPMTLATSLVEPMKRMGLLDGDSGMALPTSVFVDRQGRIASVHVGAISREELSATVTALLEETATSQKAKRDERDDK